MAPSPPLFFFFFFFSSSSLRVLHAPNNGAPDLQPVDTIIELFIHQTNHSYVISSDEIQTMRDLCGRLRVVRGPDDPFDGLR